MIDLWRGSLVVVAASFIGAAVASALILWWGGFLPSLAPLGSSYGYCNILRLPVYGTVVTIRPEMPLADTVSADDIDATTQPDTAYAVSTEIEDTLRFAAADPNIRGLLVDVDSYGGSGVGGGEIAVAIRRFGKPSAAVIHDYGVSAGYLVASAADAVFASENSSVGSIGVTYSYADQSKKNQQEGITYHALASGPYKDTGSIDKPLTEAERVLLMRDVRIMHDNFVRAVAEGRRLPVEKVVALADGSSMLGKAALEAGLIDQLGGTEEALAFLEAAMGEPAAVCW